MLHKLIYIAECRNAHGLYFFRVYLRKKQYVSFSYYFAGRIEYISADGKVFSEAFVKASSFKGLYPVKEVSGTASFTAFSQHYYRTAFFKGLYGVEKALCGLIEVKVLGISSAAYKNHIGLMVYGETVGFLDIHTACFP